MEEDIKILEEFAHDLMQDYIYSQDEIPQCDRRLKQAIENLIQRFYVVKSEYKREEYRNELLEEEIREYRNNFIPKSKVKEKKKELSDKDLEIYETDSEDVIIAKYEDRAVLDFCNSILED